MTDAPRLPIALFALGLASVAAPAAAQDTGVVFGGVTVGEAPGGFLGVNVALPGAELGRGPAVRAVLTRSDYEYDSGPTRIDGRSQSVTLQAVYQFSGSWGFANLAAGGVYQDTRLRPDDPGNPNRGDEWDGVVSVDGLANAGQWRLGGFASYRIGLEEHYVQLEASRFVAGTLRLGAEVVDQGDPNYERRLYGGLLVVDPAPKWQVRLSGGALRQEGQNGGYATLSVIRTF